MNLFDRLEIYQNSAEVEAIQGGYQHELDTLIVAKNETGDQIFVTTATWGLDEWEHMLNLEKDASLSDEFRRERIISKLRGSGTTTKALIDSVAESFTNGEVTVTENYSDYTFTITFTSIRGQPPNLEQLKLAINEIKPAHLGVLYVFMYTTHGEIHDAQYTHGALASYRHSEVKSVEV